GTGLGLATVYGIVGQSGGSIQVQSEPNCGTTFSIFMPQSDGVAEMRPVAAPGGPLQGTETILLVEDEEAVRGLTARSLQGYGHHVLQARDGEEALNLAKAKGTTIHLLVTDVVMPGIGGLELARDLVGKRPKMRVLFMSGYTDEFIDRRGVLQSDAAFLP